MRVVLTTALALTGLLQVDVAQGALLDRAGLPNPAISLSLTSALGSGYIGGSPGSTAPAQLERSAFSNAVTFQAHRYDYDADLFHMRARMFDPRTGAFLQRDPVGYQDSVNLYAAFQHNPLTNRDPTGRWVHILIGAGVGLIYNGLHQWAEIHDGARQNFSFLELGASGVAGAVTAGTLAAAGAAFGVLEVGVTAGVGSGIYGLHSAAKRKDQGHHATAAVEFLGAALSIVAAGSSGSGSNIGPGPQFALATAPSMSAAGAARAGLGELAVVATQTLPIPGLGNIFSSGETPPDPDRAARTVTGYHGASSEKILGIIEKGGFTPRGGEVFLSDSPGSTFMHGVDSLRKASFSIEVEVAAQSGQNIVHRSTPGVPNTTVVTANDLVPVTIKRMLVRRPDGEGGFVTEVIEGIDAIKAYLAR